MDESNNGVYQLILLPEAGQKVLFAVITALLAAAIGYVRYTDKQTENSNQIQTLTTLVNANVLAVQDLASTIKAERELNKERAEATQRATEQLTATVQDILKIL